MSVEDDLLKIKEIKKSLNLAIKAKGSDIADDTKFDQYPGKISDISTGGKEIPFYKIGEGGNAQKLQGDVVLNNVFVVQDYCFYYAFAFSREITSFSMPLVSVINSNGMSFAFQGCTSLKSVNLPVYSLGGRALAACFMDCTGLTRFDFPLFTKLVSSRNTDCLYNCFGNCTNLKEIHFLKTSETLVKSLDSYSTKFGAANATIYFDL